MTKAEIWAHLAGLARGRIGRHVIRSAIAVFGAIVLFGLVGHFGAPPLVRRVVAPRIAAALKRTVSVGAIDFNPYRLRLELGWLAIGDPGGGQRQFVNIYRLEIHVSWQSFFRLKPIIKEVTVDHPSFSIVRKPDRTFNISDLIERITAPAKPHAPSTPTRFSVSNIRLIDGEVRFDDELLGTHHVISNIVIGLPFITNLPAYEDIYVQPAVRMDIDGSRFRLKGKSRPFSAAHESILEFSLHRLELGRYLTYIPNAPPVTLPSAALSALMRIHFQTLDTGPVVRVEGAISLDDLDLRDNSGVPMLTLKHSEVTLLDVEPFVRRIHLGRFFVNGFRPTLILEPHGGLNYAILTTHRTYARTPSVFAASKPVAAASKVHGPGEPASQSVAIGATPSPARVAASAPTSPAMAINPTITATAPLKAAPPAVLPARSGSKPELDLTLDDATLVNGGVAFSDKRATPPANASLDALSFDLKGLSTGQGHSAPFDFHSKLNGGGSIAAKGTLDLGRSSAKSEVTFTKIALAPYNSFLAATMPAGISSGILDVQAGLVARFGAEPINLHVEPATIALADFALDAPDKSANPVGLKALKVVIGQFDLASRNAVINEATVDELRAIVRRAKDGTINLQSLVGRGEATSATSRATAVSPVGQAVPAAQLPWRCQVASIMVQKSRIELEDDAATKPVKLVIAPIDLHLRDVSSDLSHPVKFDFSARFPKRGEIQLSGQATPDPLSSNARINIRRLDIAALAPYIGSRLNATIARGAFSAEGEAGLARVRDSTLLSYRGDAALYDVRMLDKVNNRLFARWGTFALRRIDFHFGNGPTRAEVGLVDLASFYARIILNSNGQLNLRDLLASPASRPQSLTEPKARGAAPTVSGINASSEQPEIEIGRTTLSDGTINYSDYFIKPNYNADLTDVAGEIGSFGTQSTAPARLQLDGKVNGSAPVDINGSINPLAPMAYVDITAKAMGIELTGLSPYSAKYTGYPIEKGTLSLDVHYLLDQQKLTAENKLILDQLTFGDRVESSSALNLPIRLAVALLKDSQGRIDLSIPVSGSLSDPQFSIGAVIWKAVSNLIIGAAAAPFKLLASVVGAAANIGGTQANLSHIDFEPGRATLTPSDIQNLSTLAKALNERPGLQLEIRGAVNPAVDREGLKRAIVDRQVAMQKVREMAAEGEIIKPDRVTFTADEYDKYLRKAYKAAIFQKPSNFLGFNKSLPPAEMIRLMVEHTEVTDTDLRKLADDRAKSVRSWLSARVSPARLFLLPPDLKASSGTKGATYGADLALR